MTVFDAQIPGPQGGFSDHIRRWRLDARLHLVIIAELLAAAILIAASPVPVWLLATVVVGMLLVATVSYSGATLATWTGRLARLNYFRRRHSAARARATMPAPFTVELHGAGPVGMIWDGQYAVTMIALHGRAFSPTVLVPSGADTIDTAPLGAIISQLRQFAGLELHSVNVVTVGSRVAPDGRYTPKYEEIVGDRAAVGQRHTWLVLRLCPQACMAAMLYRGDAAAATAAATERVRQAVLRSGCRAVTCTKDQIKDATHDLLAGADLSRMQEGWTQLDSASDYVSTYRIAGEDLTTRVLNDVWTVRSNTTVITVQLTADSAGEVLASAVVRFHTRAPLTHPPLLALRTVVGQAFDSVLASLPLGDRALRLEMSARKLHGDTDLLIPVTASGPMFGMTVTGVPFLMPLTDPLQATRISLAADLSTTIPILLRASAAGAVILIHTDRPEIWHPLCDNDYRISIAGEREPLRTPSIIVSDGAGHGLTAGERGHTLITLCNSPEVDADVTMVQDTQDHLVVSTPAVQGIRLAIMRPRNEAQFLAHLHSGAVLP
ncbi:MAG: type VII secretion protein EccE [Actinomycetia bacterium]|nr:type VII secretion protein EccE [Actinomycetes bacterium]